MEELENLFEMIKIHDFEVGSQYWVDVTYINNPLDFYVRPVAYRHFMVKVQECGGQIKPSELILNKVVVFMSKKLHSCIRGRITAINHEDFLCDIYAIDNGFTENSVSLKRICNPSPNGTSVPSLITHCELANCVPKNGSFSKDAVDAMKYYVGEERAQIIVRGYFNNKLKVDLINSCPDDISTLLALTDYTILGFPGNSSENQVLQKKVLFKHRVFKVNDVIDVRYQSGTSLNSFYVALEEDHKNNAKQRCDFRDYCNTQRKVKFSDIKPGDAVGVFLPRTNSYERATIKGFFDTDSKVFVQLMDWGTKMEVSLSAIRLIKADKYFQNPVCAIYCKAEKEQQTEEFKQIFIPGFKLQIKIKAPGDRLNTPMLVHIVIPQENN